MFPSKRCYLEVGCNLKSEGLPSSLPNSSLYRIPLHTKAVPIPQSLLATDSVGSLQLQGMRFLCPPPHRPSITKNNSGEISALHFTCYKTRVRFPVKQPPLVERALQMEWLQINEVLSPDQHCSHSLYESSPLQTKKLLVHRLPGS